MDTSETFEIPDDWQQVAGQVDSIGKQLREDAISKTFSPEAEYKRCLDVLTGCYMFLVTQFKQWRAIKENNYVAKFCDLKNNTGLTEKFTAASGEKEASNFVRRERYYRDWLEGWLLAAEQGIYTVKKHLDSENKERDINKFE